MRDLVPLLQPSLGGPLADTNTQADLEDRYMVCLVGYVFHVRDSHGAVRSGAGSCDLQ